MSTLQDLGCGEMRVTTGCGDTCYVGRFASELTAPGIVPFGAVFAKETLTEENLLDFVHVVVENELPFGKVLGWLLEPSISSVLPSGRILAWLRSLYFEIADVSCDKSPGAKHTRALIKSSLNAHFRLKVYVTQRSRPQETICVVPLVFPGGDSGTPHVMLEQRGAREQYIAFGGSLGRMPLKVIRVSDGFSSGSGSGSSSGSRYLLFGVDCRKDVDWQVVGARDLWNGDLVEIAPLDGVYRRFYVGAMSGDGDCRYRQNTSRTTGIKYGYERVSTTYLVAAVFVDGGGTTALRAPVHPWNGRAVMRGAIVSLPDVRSGFTAEGAFPPGMNVHREQLERVCVMIPRIAELVSRSVAPAPAPALVPMHTRYARDAQNQCQDYTEILYLEQPQEEEEEVGVRGVTA